MKKYLRSVPLFVLLFMPLMAQAQSATELQARAQSLLQQVAQLQQQLSATGGHVSIDSSSCPNVGRTLRRGSSGTEVSRLQQFLALDPSVYPEGTVSGHYGGLTQSAVSRWQAKYNIVSSGSPATTGWGVVGPRTAAAIALLCSTGSTAGSTAVNPPTVGGVIQVSPVSGSAALFVTIQATLNTMSSCTGATYILSYGDGTQAITIPVANGTCQPIVQTFGHTYNYGGTYQITLTAGSHQTSATVTVAGPPSPQQIASSGIPADSVKASITSGLAPLTVVFSGTVSSLSAYGCTGTCTETLNFGDGTIGLIQLPATPSNGVGTWQSYIINHTYATVGTYNAQLQSATGASVGSSIAITVRNPVTTPTPTATPTTTPATDSVYAILSVNPNVGGNPLAATASLTLPTCALYQVNWGDASPISTNTAPCTTGGSVATISHTYSAAGNYNIRLNDGSGVVKASAGLTIVN